MRFELLALACITTGRADSFRTSASSSGSSNRSPLESDEGTQCHVSSPHAAGSDPRVRVLRSTPVFLRLLLANSKSKSK